jgi:dTDP-L-rhamnose 4-epimerase
VFEDGAQRRDFIHVRDVARANVAAVAVLADDPSPGMTAYNIASGCSRTVGELAAELAKAVDGPPPVITGRFRAGDVRHIMAAADKARSHLDFLATTPFEHGVREFAHAPLRT